MKPEVLPHRIAAEKALGKPLPKGVVVHHLDRDRKNDENNNLVICEDSKYHALLHIRQRAKDAGAEPHWRKCTYCKEYDHPDNLIFRHTKRGRYRKKTYLTISHRKCKYVLGPKKEPKPSTRTSPDKTKNLLKNGRVDERTTFGLIYARTTMALLKLKNQSMLYTQPVQDGFVLKTATIEEKNHITWYGTRILI